MGNVEVETEVNGFVVWMHRQLVESVGDPDFIQAVHDLDDA